MPLSDQFTEKLLQWSRGDGEAFNDLTSLIYAELHRLAASFLRNERSDHTLQATALVHEAYLQVRNLNRMEWKSRAHFIAISADAMRRILVDHARARMALKRGGRRIQVDLAEEHALTEPDFNLVALDQALDRFSKAFPRQAQIVTLRFFGGLQPEEIIEVLGGALSRRTVERDWRFARAWLQGAMASEGRHGYQ